jgi:metal-sulfur cluster biosynthetic enzyme
MTEESSTIPQPSGPSVTRDEVISMIKTIIDPELYIDIWTLGLIYDIDIVEETLNIRMTFTSVACPAGPQLVGEIKDKAKELSGIKETNVEIVFQPPWQPSEELKALLGIG